MNRSEKFDKANVSVMSRSIKLTSRDVEVLSFLNSQGVATADQLRRAFFPSNGSFFVRLHKLIKAGLVESVSIVEGLNTTPSRLADIRELAELQSKNWRQLKLYRIADKMLGPSRFRSPLSEPIFWQHQLGLNDIRQTLKNVLPPGLFLSDPQSKREWSRFQMGGEVPIPDLVWRGDSHEIAIEFERTNKGEFRYFNRMMRYLNSDYHRIIYIAKTQAIADTLMKCAHQFPKVGVSILVDLKSVYVGLSGYKTIEKFFGVCG